MHRPMSLSASVLVLIMAIAAAHAQSASPPSNTTIPPGTKVSPLPAPDASTEGGQGAEQRPNQPAPPPSPSEYMKTQTDTGEKSGTSVPGSKVSPVPAPDASTAKGQQQQNK